MSDDIMSPIELGFAEFVAKLISEIFDATISSQAQQQEKILEMQNMLLQPDSVFLDAMLSQEYFIREVDLLLEGYFPSDSDHLAHVIYEGAPYTPAKANKKENPLIKEQLGIDLGNGDFLPKKNQLTSQGVSKIYEKAGEPLAIQKRVIFRQLVENGLPNIVVESGKINAKLTFNTAHTGQPEATEAVRNGRRYAAMPKLHDQPLVRRFASPIQPLNRYVGLLKPNLTDQVRLTVKQTSNKSPQDTQVKTNIFSEVEIHFKTIT